MWLCCYCIFCYCSNKTLKYTFCPTCSTYAITLFLYSFTCERFFVRPEWHEIKQIQCIFCHTFSLFTIISNQLCSFLCLCSESILYVEKLQRAHTRAFPVWTCHMWASQPFFDPLIVLHWGQAHEQVPWEVF